MRTRFALVKPTIVFATIIMAIISSDITKVITLDQLIPADLQAVLDDRPELSAYALRLQFVKRRLDQAQHRALAHLTNRNARVPMDVGNLDAVDEEADQLDPAQVEAAHSLVRRFEGRGGKGQPRGTPGKGGG